MQKALLLFALLATTLVAQAQSAPSTFRLLDKQGQVVAPGSTIVVDLLETNEWDETAMHSGLSIENLTTEALHLGVEAEVTAIDAGTLSFCFPDQCISYNKVQKRNNGNGSLQEQEKKNLQLEWQPFSPDPSAPRIEKGQARITFTINIMNRQGSRFPYTYTLKEQGPTYHVIFDHKGSSGLRSANWNSSPITTYNLTGQRMPQGLLPAGTYLQRLANGQCQKVVIR